MKIGFVADTHDHKENIIKIFKVFQEEGIKNVFHLGDLISPFNFKFIREVYFGNLYMVFGNNDGEKLFLTEQAKAFGVSILKHPEVLDINGFKVVAMHEPFMIEELGGSGKFDVVAYGHTHKIHLERINNTLIVNPGEACGYLTGKATFVVVETKTLEYEIREVKNERD
ncbi:MAG: metallophosphoesterase [candidate division WOR-3 bacterium]